ncbi:MAG TPA: sulfatase-like hydrolase/transferase [Pyrinomonadaceae bacterium]|jgi:hypothetical protein
MDKSLKDGVRALSLANLCLIPAWRSILDPASANFYYHLKQSPRWAELAAISLNLLLVAALFRLGIHLVRKSGRPSAFNFARYAFILVFLIPLNHFRSQFTLLPRDRMVEKLGWTGFLALAMLLILCAVFLVKRIGLPRVSKVVSTLVLILSPFLFISFAQAVWLTVKYDSAVWTNKPLAAAHPRPGQTRVVWLVFDELDYGLAFDARPQALALPELDRLRSEAFFASHAYPPASMTILSMPALINGKLVSSAQPTGPDRLFIRFDGQTEPVDWSLQPNIFTVAHAEGHNTAILGWFHPYCRLFSEVFTTCYWDTSHAVDPDRMGILSNMRRQARLSFIEIATPLKLLFPDQPEELRMSFKKAQLASYRELLQQARNAIADERLDLILVHMSIPHPPNVYDRRKGELSLESSASYLDSLALVDRTIGELRRQMESAGTWEQTTLLITSDHWFRKDQLRHTLRRTLKQQGPEQYQLLMDNSIDHRVPFILKMPGQRAGVNYEPAFNNVLSQDLLLAILRGELNEAESLAGWLDGHRSIAESPDTKNSP